MQNEYRLDRHNEKNYCHKDAHDGTRTNDELGFIVSGGFACHMSLLYSICVHFARGFFHE